MATANQQQLVDTRLRLRGETLQIVQHQRRRGLDALVRRFQAPRQVRLERPEIQPVGIILQCCQAQLALGLVAVWRSKSVVSGQSVSVRVDLGGRRIITKKTEKTDQR